MMTQSAGPAVSLIEAARRLISTSGETFSTQDVIDEAGVARQTFYRCFRSRDELILAVIEEEVAAGASAARAAAIGVDDPVERLGRHVTGVLERLRAPGESRARARFVAAEHRRLSRSDPDAIARATRPYVDLLREEIDEGTERGQLAPSDPERGAWLTMQLVLGVAHQRTFDPDDDSMLSRDVWCFCLAALGGTER